MSLFSRFSRRNDAARSVMQLLDAERENYRSTYLHAIGEQQAQHELAIPEVKVELNDEKLSGPYRYYTLDLFVRDGDSGGPMEVNLRRPNPIDPLRETWGGLDVVLHAFVWNGLEFNVDCDVAQSSAFISWIEKWIDPEDQRPRDEHRLSGIIHNVTPPERHGDGSSFSVDFGTAPLEAIVELMEVLRSAGCKNVEMGSP